MKVASKYLLFIAAIIALCVDAKGSKSKSKSNASVTVHPQGNAKTFKVAKSSKGSKSSKTAKCMKSSKSVMFQPQAAFDGKTSRSKATGRIEGVTSKAGKSFSPVEAANPNPPSDLGWDEGCDDDITSPNNVDESSSKPTLLDNEGPGLAKSGKSIPAVAEKPSAGKAGKAKASKGVIVARTNQPSPGPTSAPVIPSTNSGAQNPPPSDEPTTWVDDDDKYPPTQMPTLKVSEGGTPTPTASSSGSMTPSISFPPSSLPSSQRPLSRATVEPTVPSTTFTPSSSPSTQRPLSRATFEPTPSGGDTLSPTSADGDGPSTPSNEEMFGKNKRTISPTAVTPARETVFPTLGGLALTPLTPDEDLTPFPTAQADWTPFPTTPTNGTPPPPAPVQPRWAGARDLYAAAKSGKMIGKTSKVAPKGSKSSGGIKKNIIPFTANNEATASSETTSHSVLIYETHKVTSRPGKSHKRPSYETNEDVDLREDIPSPFGRAKAAKKMTKTSKLMKAKGAK